MTWEPDDAILGTLVLDSAFANSISLSPSTNPGTSNANITYTWDNIQWDLVLTHQDRPGFATATNSSGKYLVTHEFYGDYICPGTGFLGASTTLGNTMAFQTYQLYSNLSGNGYATGNFSSRFLNTVTFAPNNSSYWNWNGTTGSALVNYMGTRQATPRSFIRDFPANERSIQIVFAARPGNQWTAPSGVQGTDFFTAGKHIFTFRKLSHKP